MRSLASLTVASSGRDDVEHRPLLAGDAVSQSERLRETAGSLRHLSTGLQDPRGALLAQIRRERREPGLDDLDRRVEDGVRRAIPEPRKQLDLGGRAVLDSPLTREAQDRLALLVGDLALGPGHLNQRREEERRPRAQVNTESPHATQQLGDPDLPALRHERDDLLEPGVLTQLLDQLGIAVAEEDGLLGSFPVLEDILRHPAFLTQSTAPADGSSSRSSSTVRVTRVE